MRRAESSQKRKIAEAVSRAEALEAELLRFSQKRPMALILPSLFSEFYQPFLMHFPAQSSYTLLQKEREKVKETAAAGVASAAHLK